MSRTVGSATLTAAQLAQLKLASSKSGAVPKSVLEEVIKGSLALLPKVWLIILISFNAQMVYLVLSSDLVPNSVLLLSLVRFFMNTSLV